VRSNDLEEFEGMAVDDDDLTEMAQGKPVEGEKVLELAKHGEEKVNLMKCDDFTSDMKGVLARLQVTFNTFNTLFSSQLDQKTNEDLHAKIYQAVADEFQADSLMVIALAETATRRSCLDKMFRDEEVQQEIEKLLVNNLFDLLAKCGGGNSTDGAGAYTSTLDCKEAYAKMVQWQHAVRGLKSENLFEPLARSDVSDPRNCPKECSRCSRQHSSKYKKNEPFSFKCYLKDKNVVPTETIMADGYRHDVLTKVTCAKPRRRVLKFWQRKAWCEVEDWKKAYFRRNKVSALLSCSMLLLQPSRQDKGDEALETAHRVCMRVEQGMAVEQEAMQLYEETFKATLEKTGSPFDESLRWATRTLLNLGMHAGLADLIRVSEHDNMAAVTLEKSTTYMFTFDFPTTGGEQFFNEPLDEEVNHDVCYIEHRKFKGVVGVFGQFFRQAMRIPLMIVGLVIHIPAAIATFFTLLMLAFEQSFFVGLTGVVGSPVLLAAAILKVSAEVFLKVGRLLRIADWDCDPSLVVAEGIEPQCTVGMYFKAKRSISGVQLQCLPQHNGIIVFSSPQVAASMMEVAEEQEHSEEEQEELDAESSFNPLRRCPRGTEKDRSNGYEGDPLHCKYDGKLDLWSPSTPALNVDGTDYFTEGKASKSIRFRKRSQAINMTTTFGAEFVQAWNDNATFNIILADFAKAEFERNGTMKSEFEGWIEEIKQNQDAFSDKHGDWITGFHNVEADIFAAWFVMEHIAEHAVIEGMIHVLHHIEHAAAHSVAYGSAQHAVAVHASTGFSKVTAAKYGAKFLHNFLHYVMTPYLIERTMNLIFVRTQDSWLRKSSHAEDFVNRLVLRSECTKNRLAMGTEEDNTKGPENQEEHDPAYPFRISNIQPIVLTVCQEKQTELLSKLFQRTHKVYERIFDKIAGLGKCLNPGEKQFYILSSTKRYQSKVYCIERLYRTLREHGGLPGQLWTALVYMTTIMAETDELLNKKHYKTIMQDKFGVTIPADLTQNWNELEDIQNAGKNESTMDEKFSACFMVISTHRAYETSLSVLAESIDVWMQTFARSLLAVNVRGTWLPCQRVFHKVGDVESNVTAAGRVCKNKHNVWSPEQKIAEGVSCSSPLNYPQWICHKRNWWLIRAQQDAMWCKTAGIFDSYHYKYFGEDLEKCGCACCKRRNAYESLWPELDVKAKGTH